MDTPQVKNRSTRRFGMTHLRDAARSVVQPVLKQAGFVQAQVILNWTEIVGEQLGKFCQPRRLQFRPNQRLQGTLCLDVTPGAGLLVQSASTQIQERVNAFLGYQAVSHMQLRQNAQLNKISPPSVKSTAKPPMAVDTSMLESNDFESTPDLKNTLKNFALAMMQIKTILLACMMTVGSVYATTASKPYKLPEITLGQADAPISMIIYTSLTCDHCAQFHRETFDKLKENYIDTGKVRVILREYVSDGWALRAAAICHCGPKDKYLEMMTAFFEHQKDWIYAQDYTTAMAKVARPFGMKRSAVNACVSNDKLFEAILERRMAGAKSYKIDRTPWLVINGKSYPGALSFKELEKILCPLLVKTESEESQVQNP